MRVAIDREAGRGGAGSNLIGWTGGLPGTDPVRATLALMAPGTTLRDGLERILRGRTGALIVLGHDRVVESLCTGGFPLDVDFSATRLRELCKMDGAVVLSSDGTKIVRAAAHLMPDSTIPSEESGTRHRTAERVAKQTKYPVISVSQSMHIIGLYVSGQRHVIDDSAAILSKANQALATLERYKLRLDEVSGTLSALEIEDLVTVRDAVAVIQRLEMVRRIADEIAGYVVELGTDGRLLALQLEELMAGVESDRTLVIRDYLPDSAARRPRTLDEALTDLNLLSATELIDLVAVAKALGRPGERRFGRGSVASGLPVARQGPEATEPCRRTLGRAFRKPPAAPERDRGGSSSCGWRGRRQSAGCTGGSLSSG